jgi:hypothetical protein
MPLRNLLKVAIRNSSSAAMFLCLIVSVHALCVKEANASSRLLSQQDFVYTPSEMLNFDIEAYLQANAPLIAGHAEVI